MRRLICATLIRPSIQSAITTRSITILAMKIALKHKRSRIHGDGTTGPVLAMARYLRMKKAAFNPSW